MADLKQEVGVLGNVGGHIEDVRAAEQPVDRNSGHIITISSRDPVPRRIEMGADVLAGVDVVVTPEGSAVIESTHFLEAEVDEIGVRFGQLESWGVGTERTGEIDDPEIVVLQMSKKPLQRLK